MSAKSVLHPADNSDTSYHSQISSIFKVEGKKDLYIAVADRWMPKHMALDYNKYSKIFEKRFNPNATEQIEVDDTLLKCILDKNTSVADYVWLPILFNGERPYIDWKESWKIEDYE